MLVDDPGRLDLRFELRGHRPQNNQIVLILVSQKEWNSFHARTRRYLVPSREIESLTDSFFWNSTTWIELLSRLENYGARSIGVTFYFGDAVRTGPLAPNERTTLQDPRVIWAASLDGSGGTLKPLFVNDTGSNAGFNDIRPDKDGIVRRLGLQQVPYKVQGLALAERATGQSFQIQPFQEGDASALINFQGPQSQFQTYDFQAVMDGFVPRSAIDGRIVIIGSKDAASHLHTTPLGPMSRAEILANVTDNVLMQRWIYIFNPGFYIFLLALLTVFTIWIIRTYPLTIALIFFIWLGTAIASLSAWAFDTHYVWFPVVTPLVMLASVYIVFLSYQVTLNDQRTWILEHEQRYFVEIQNLKNNFVSLISHDLKTPIAKIRGIADRLLVKAPGHEFATDLQNMCKASDELNKYIESILQVLRVESRDFKISHEVGDINELCQEAIDQLQPLANEKSILIDPHLEPMFSIEMDTTLIREVIHNLLENAIKYSPHNSRVQLTTKEIDDHVIVVVKDEGPGIPPGETEKIWDKFYRGTQHSLSIKGSGLGLFLVKYFVELHNGTVFLESSPEGGTRIGFQLPIHDAKDATETMET
jgi:signal transduction histidine kinase